MFSGVGAPEQAIKNLGLDWEIVGYSEIDKYAIQTYEKNFPGGVNYGDATAINETELPDFDMLIGGFPCQAFSVAGRRGGFADTRGTLFFDIARIAKHKRPTYLVLENVKGLLSHDSGKTFSTILRVLSETGYDVSWSIHNSKDYGVPQNRERIYIIGHLRGTPRPEVLPIGGNDGSALKQIVGGSQGNRVYDPSGVSSTLASQAGGLGAKTGLYKISGVDRKARRYSLKETDLSGTLTATDYKGVDKIGATIVAQRGRGEPPVQTLEPRYDGLTNSLTSVQKDNMVAKTIRAGGRNSPHGSKQNWDSYKVRGRIRRLTPLECERLQGFPDGHTEGVSDTQRYKQMGNSMTVQVMEHVLREILNG